MTSNIAPLRGTTSLYCYLLYQPQHVMIQKDNYEYTIIKQEIFNDLYYELDDSRTALKSDCIEYCIYHPNKPLESYPEWFKEAIDDGWIVNDYLYSYTFLESSGEVVMTTGSVVLRNFKGDLRYMERSDFDKYYEVVDGWYRKYL